LTRTSRNCVLFDFFEACSYRVSIDALKEPNPPETLASAEVSSVNSSKVSTTLMSKLGAKEVGCGPTTKPFTQSPPVSLVKLLYPRPSLVSRPA